MAHSMKIQNLLYHSFIEISKLIYTLSTRLELLYQNYCMNVTNLLSLEKRNLDHYTKVQFFLSQVRCIWQKVKISKILESTFLSRLWWSCRLCTFSSHTFSFFLLISVEMPLSQRSVVQEWPVVSLPSSFRLSSGQLSSPDILVFSDEHIVKSSLFSIQFLSRSTLTVLKGRKNV